MLYIYILVIILSSIHYKERIKNKKDNVILIPDNEPRNKEIVKQIERFINDGY